MRLAETSSTCEVATRPLISSGRYWFMGASRSGLVSVGAGDSQAKLRLRLDQPAPQPDALVRRLQDVLNFSVSLPQAFREGDAVRRRQIFHAICANPTAKDRKALYTAKEPWSFFENAGLIRPWYTTEEQKEDDAAHENEPVLMQNEHDIFVWFTAEKMKTVSHV